ncbi:MAG: decarboxylating 6-phosphogluconate dehydrogenase [Bdellovibrionales bacterium]|nr:decarboxylating 6-phosphogluconate dehydrogenase [Bdellovibrionales bacterium]
MRVGYIGLGKMGANQVRRLLGGGHEVCGYDRSADVVKELAGEGMQPADSVEDLAAKLDSPRIFWMLVPQGDPIDNTITALKSKISPGDIIVDGGNSNFKDSMRRAAALKEHGIHYLDIGTSGGVWGLEFGYCMMIGGDKSAFQTVEPLLKTLAPKDGYLYIGASGSGHYVKMIHNGIEYALMQAYAEGFDLLEACQFDVDMPAVADLWNHGSVIRSWLLELGARALKEDPKLSELEGWVNDSGMGRWTAHESIDLSVPAPTITAALFARFRSRRSNTFSDRFLSALRNQFGGHAVKEAK